MAALVALIQLEAAKAGKPSIIAVTVTSAVAFVQETVASVVDGFSGLGTTLADAPNLYKENAALKTQNATLESQNAHLTEQLAVAPEVRAILEVSAHQSGIVANTIGFDPEGTSRSIVIDRGTDAGVRRDMGVIDADGVVGRIVAADRSTATVLLVTDGASKVPAVVQRGRFWGIATGTNSRVRLQYVSQDAKLKIGDKVVTGEGRSFHAGLAIGRISEIAHPEGSLYQTAVIAPAVAFGRLAHVFVLQATGTNPDPGVDPDAPTDDPTP